MKEVGLEAGVKERERGIVHSLTDRNCFLAVTAHRPWILGTLHLDSLADPRGSLGCDESLDTAVSNIQL